jgi:AcrR family transcriptional regulator
VDSVKAGRRPYRSDRRRKQAAATRDTILDAARLLFSQRGYSGTTVEAIAESAGVAAITVYSTFGSKRALLARLVDLAVAGDEEAVELLQREEPRHVLGLSDQRSQIQHFARDIAQRMERVAPLLEVLSHAARTEPEIAELLEQLLRQRLAGMRAFTGALRRNGPLRDGMSAAKAAETVWAMTSAEIVLLTSRHLGWTRKQFVEWLDRSLASLLLVPTRQEP